MTPEEIVEYAADLARAWRQEETDHATVENIDRALRCHQGAIVLEQLIYDIQQRMAAPRVATSSEVRASVDRMIAKHAPSLKRLASR
jgi:hypothetical protein